MNHSEDQALSRRKWLEMTAGASLGSGLLAVTSASAEPAKTAPNSGHDLGARIYNIRTTAPRVTGTTSIPPRSKPRSTPAPKMTAERFWFPPEFSSSAPWK